MPKRTLIETSVLALLCVSCAPVEAQNTAGKKKIAMSPALNVAPRVVPAATVPVRGLGGRPTGITSIRCVPSRTYPSNHLQKGLYYKQQGKSDEALLEFILSVQEDPKQVRAFFEQAEIFNKKGKPVLARSALEQALAISPSFAEARSALVQMHVASGNFLGAASEVGKLLGFNTDKQAPPAITARKDKDEASLPVRTAETREEQPDAAQAIASWLTPESKKESKPEPADSAPSSAAASPGPKAGSYEAVAAALGITPPSSPSPSPSWQTDSVTPPVTIPPEKKSLPSLDSVLAAIPSPPAIPAVPASAITPNVPTTTITSPATPAGLDSAINGTSGDAGRSKLLDRTLSMMRHPTVPRMFRWHEGNASAARPPMEKYADPHQPPVASWVKTLSGPLRRRGKHEQPSAFPGLAAGTAGAVTVTHLSTPAEDGVEKTSQPPATLSPEMQKMLSSMIAPTAQHSPTAPPTPPAVQPTSPPPSQTSTVDSRRAMAAPPQAGIPSAVAEAMKGFSDTPFPAPLPDPAAPARGYGLMQDNASVRMPDFTREAVDAQSALSTVHQDNWMENMWKKATAILPKLPEMPHFSLPSLFGGKPPETPPAVSQTVASAKPVQPVPQASSPNSKPPVTPQISPDFKALPAAVADVLSKLDGDTIAPSPAPVVAPVIAKAEPQPPGDVSPASALPDPQINPSAPAGVDSAPAVSVPVAPPESTATPPAAEGIPSIINSILTSLDGDAGAPRTTVPDGKTPVSQSRSTEPIPAAVAAVLAPIGNAIPPVSASAATAAAATAAAGTAAELPANVASALAGIPLPPQPVVANHGAQRAMPVPPASAANVPPPAAPVPKDIQHILGKISAALPQPSGLGAFFHFKKAASQRMPAPNGLKLATAIIPAMPAGRSSDAVPTGNLSPGKTVAPAVAAIPVAPAKRDLPEGLPSVVQDILNKVDTKFFPQPGTKTTVPGTFVPAPVAVEHSIGDAPHPVESNRTAPMMAGPAPTPSTPSVFECSPVPEVRPKAPVPVAVNAQAMLSKNAVNPSPVALSLPPSHGGMLPTPGAVRLIEGNPMLPSFLNSGDNSHRVDMQLPQTVSPRQLAAPTYAQPPGKMTPKAQSASLPVVVRAPLNDVGETALPISVPATIARTLVPEPVAIERTDIPAPSPVTPSRSITTQPLPAPVPTGAAPSNNFTNVVPEVRPETQTSGQQTPLVAQLSPELTRSINSPAALTPQAAAPAPGGGTSSPNTSARKLISGKTTRSGAFTYMQPVFDSDRNLMGLGQLRTIPAAAARTETPGAPAPPPEDAVTKRMRYLIEHGTANLKPGEAFMYSEETGEGILFLPGQEAQHRKLAAPTNHDEVMEKRRPDMVPPDLQYSLTLLGKLLPAGPHKNNNDQDERPISGPTLDQLMNQTGKGVWGWMKDTFKFK